MIRTWDIFWPRALWLAKKWGRQKEKRRSRRGSSSEVKPGEREKGLPRQEREDAVKPGWEVEEPLGEREGEPPEWEEEELEEGGEEEGEAEAEFTEEVEEEAVESWSSGEEDDGELIEGFLGGDEECFNRLVLKYQHKVHNLCYRILGDRDEALDMAQEIFLTVHKSVGGFRGESLFSTWIFRVTVNHCKNRIKYLGRRRYYHSLSLRTAQEVEEGEIYVEPEDDRPDPEDSLASEEVQAMVQEAIESLEPDHRLAVVLRDIQGLAYEEIAEILGIKVGTVKSRIHRGRMELKKKLTGKLRIPRPE